MLQKNLMLVIELVLNHKNSKEQKTPLCANPTAKNVLFRKSEAQ